MSQNERETQVLSFNSAEAFLDYLDPTQEHWLPARIQSLSLSGGNGWLYRGHADAEWPLSPSVFREGEPLRRFGGSWVAQVTASTLEAARRSYAWMHTMAEHSVVHEFLQLADQLGIETPLSGFFDQVFEAFFEKAKRHIIPVSGAFGEAPKPVPPVGLQDALGLAQHHGIPTRLLDWTLSPYVAAFFACFESENTSVRDGRPEKVAVWALNPGYSTSQLRCFTAPYSRNLNLRSQRGYFTVDAKANDVFAKEGRWRSQEEAVLSSWTDPAQPAPLRKMCVPALEAKEVLRRLWILGISPVHLMPSLDMVAKTFLFYQRLFDRSPMTGGSVFDEGGFAERPDLGVVPERPET